MVEYVIMIQKYGFGLFFLNKRMMLKKGYNKEIVFCVGK